MTHEELKAIRESQGLSTQEQMADLLHISRVCYLRYENGTRKVPEYIARSLEFFLSLSKRAQEKFLKECRNQ